MRERICLNDGWLFTDKKKYSLKSPKKYSPKAVAVAMPHSAVCVEDNAKKAFRQGVMWYRNEFDAVNPKEYGAIALEFDGVMHSCYVYLNGRKVGEHFGGYTKFFIDITGKVKQGRNVLSLKVSNEDDYMLPPGIAQKRAERQYYGGIYRRVYLNYFMGSSISEPVMTEEIGEGGIIISDDILDSRNAVIKARIALKNYGGKKVKQEVATLFAALLDREDEVIARTATQCVVKKNGIAIVNVALPVIAPKFWAPSYPYLYKVRVDVKVGGRIIETKIIKHGIRTVAVTNKGFILNGTKLVIRGVSRQEEYPYIGNALSANAEYRDAYKIKKAGFNLVKLAHYPQSEAFLDACDELGLMVIDTVPGHQYCRKGEFKHNFMTAIRNIAKRDRNHTSIVMWQPTPSETDKGEKGASDKFFKECADLLREELKNANAPIISGDSIGRKNVNKAGYDAPYCMIDTTTGERNMQGIEGLKGLAVDYGDYEFGGEASTSRAARDSEADMLLQAWNMQYAHNRNLSSEDVMGDVLSNMFDYYDADGNIVRSGIMDINRIPKYSYEFFRSQDKRPSAYMVFAPTYWENAAIDTLPVFSNCDRVRLYINNKFVAERRADYGVGIKYAAMKEGRVKREAKVFDKALHGKGDVKPYWSLGYTKSQITCVSPLALHSMKCMYDGANCNKIASPPFTFRNIIYRSGTVVVAGIVDGELVAKQVIRSSERAHKVRVRVDYSAKPLMNDGEDAIFVYGEVIDRNGTVVTGADNIVHFSVKGGVILGKSDVEPEAGIATTIIRADKGAKEVVLTAIADGLLGQRVGVKLDIVVEPTVIDGEIETDKSVKADAISEEVVVENPRPAVYVKEKSAEEPSEEAVDAKADKKAKKESKKVAKEALKAAKAAEEAAEIAEQEAIEAEKQAAKEAKKAEKAAKKAAKQEKKAAEAMEESVEEPVKEIVDETDSQIAEDPYYAEVSCASSEQVVEETAAEEEVCAETDSETEHLDATEAAPADVADGEEKIAE